MDLGHDKFTVLCATRRLGLSKQGEMSRSSAVQESTQYCVACRMSSCLAVVRLSYIFFDSTGWEGHI